MCHQWLETSLQSCWTETPRSVWAHSEEQRNWKDIHFSRSLTGRNYTRELTNPLNHTWREGLTTSCRCPHRCRPMQMFSNSWDNRPSTLWSPMQNNTSLAGPSSRLLRILNDALSDQCRKLIFILQINSWKFLSIQFFHNSHLCLAGHFTKAPTSSSHLTWMQSRTNYLVPGLQDHQPRISSSLIICERRTIKVTLSSRACHSTTRLRLDYLLRETLNCQVYRIVE